MCMVRLHDQKRRHRIGFKIVKNTDVEDVFESFVMGGTYTMNEWYDAGDPQFLMDVKASIKSNKGRTIYKGGIHYFRAVPESEARMVLNNPVDYAILKVKLKGVMETGIEAGVEAGVARMACPVKVMSGNVTLKDYEKQLLKKHVTLTNGQFYLDLFKSSSRTPTITEIDAICERATKSAKSYCEYIMFIDMFERQHPVFKFYTKAHIFLYKSSNPKHKNYMKYYSRFTSLDDEIVHIHTGLLEQRKELGILPISGPVA